MSTPILMQANQVLFVKRADYAERLAGLLGAKVASHTVHAVDRVDLTIHQDPVRFTPGSDREIGSVAWGTCLGSCGAGPTGASDRRAWLHDREVLMRSTPSSR